MCMWQIKLDLIWHAIARGWDEFQMKDIFVVLVLIQYVYHEQKNGPVLELSNIQHTICPKINHHVEKQGSITIAFINSLLM